MSVGTCRRVNRDVKADVEQTESEATVHDQSAAEPEPKLNLAFKEGQTIKINITVKPVLTLKF